MNAQSSRIKTDTIKMINVDGGYSIFWLLYGIFPQLLFFTIHCPLVVHISYCALYRRNNLSWSKSDELIFVQTSVLKLVITVSGLGVSNHIVETGHTTTAFKDSEEVSKANIYYFLLWNNLITSALLLKSSFYKLHSLQETSVGTQMTVLGDVT